MKPKIGLAAALEEAGIRPDVLCGCSVGALVGAAYADGDLAALEQWVSGLAWKDVVGLLDVSLAGGLLKGDKLIAFFERHFVDKDFSALPLPFACVATDLANGREVWLREGSVAAAVRASIALPGLFAPATDPALVAVPGAGRRCRHRGRPRLRHRRQLAQAWLGWGSGPRRGLVRPTLG